jgi:hypothetical protein
MSHRLPLELFYVVKDEVWCNMMVPERLRMPWCIIRQQTALIPEELITICKTAIIFLLNGL